MKKYQKKLKEWLLLLLMAAACIAVLVGPIWLAVAAILPPDQAEMEECFQEDAADLKLVARYLSGLDYSYISIDEDRLEEGLMLTDAGIQYQKIENASAMEALDRLLGWGDYNCVTKSEQTIVFEKWDCAGKDRGIAYTIREETKPMVQFLIHSEPLSESGWYYYEACYEEYRTRNELW